MKLVRRAHTAFCLLTEAFRSHDRASASQRQFRCKGHSSRRGEACRDVGDTGRPGGREQGVHSRLCRARRGPRQLDPWAAAQPALGPAAGGARAHETPPADPAPLPRRADAGLQRDDGRNHAPRGGQLADRRALRALAEDAGDNARGDRARRLRPSGNRQPAAPARLASQADQLDERPRPAQPVGRSRPQPLRRQRRLPRDDGASRAGSARAGTPAPARSRLHRRKRYRRDAGRSPCWPTARAADAAAALASGCGPIG